MLVVETIAKILAPICGWSSDQGDLPRTRRVAWSEAPVDRLNQIQTYAFNHETIVASKITP